MLFIYLCYIFIIDKRFLLFCNCLFNINYYFVCYLFIYDIWFIYLLLFYFVWPLLLYMFYCTTNKQTNNPTTNKQTSNQTNKRTNKQTSNHQILLYILYFIIILLLFIYLFSLLSFVAGRAEDVAIKISTPSFFEFKAFMICFYNLFIYLFYLCKTRINKNRQTIAKHKNTHKTTSK